MCRSLNASASRKSECGSSPCTIPLMASLISLSSETDLDVVALDLAEDGGRGAAGPRTESAFALALRNRGEVERQQNAQDGAETDQTGLLPPIAPVRRTFAQTELTHRLLPPAEPDIRQFTGRHSRITAPPDRCRLAINTKYTSAFASLRLSYTGHSQPVGYIERASRSQTGSAPCDFADSNIRSMNGDSEEVATRAAWRHATA